PEDDVCAPVADRVEQAVQLARTVTVIPVEEDDDVRVVRRSEPGQAGATVPAARFDDDPCPVCAGNLPRPVYRTRIDDQHLSDQREGNLLENAGDGARLVVGGNDEAEQHPDRPIPDASSDYCVP